MMTQKVNLASLVTNIQNGRMIDNATTSLTESFQEYITDGNSQWELNSAPETANMSKQMTTDTNHKDVYEKENVSSDTYSVHKDKVQDSVRQVDETSMDESSVDNLTKEEMEALQENIRDVLKETLDVTDEEIDEILASMDLNLLNLLKPETLQEFLMEATNSEPVDLLTNSSLIDTFQQIGTEIDALKVQFSIDESRLEQFLAGDVNITENVMSDEVLSIDVEETVNDASVMQKSDVVMKTEQQVDSSAEMNVNVDETTDTIWSELKSDAEVNSFSVKEEETGIQVTVQNTSGKKGQESGQLFEHSQQGIAADVVNQLTQAVNDLEDIPVSFTSDVQQAEIIQQVIEEIRVTSGNDVNRIEVQLYPQHLGRVQIQVMMKNGVLTAQLHAETEMAKEAIESQLQQLKETFQAKSIQVEAVEVSVGTSNFQREQDRQDSTKNQNETRSRGRRIRLDDVGMPMDELPGDEGVDSERLKAQGASVEFTA